MLETLVSSKIRRSLLEYVLLHPADHFYLRGLAKDLGVTVTPLRRELKRLEHAGMLSAFQEGNMLFYTVNTGSPEFLQLKGAGLSTQEMAQGSRLKAQGNGSGLQPSTFSLQPMQVGVISAGSARTWWRSPLSGPMLVGVAAVGMALLLIVAGLGYLTLTNRQVISQVTRALSGRKAEVTVVMPPVPAVMTGGSEQRAASGAMRGRRWQIVPGGFGGFSSGSSSESY